MNISLMDKNFVILTGAGISAESGVRTTFHLGKLKWAFARVFFMDDYEDDNCTAPDDWLEENFGDEIRSEEESLEELLEDTECQCGGDIEDYPTDGTYNCEMCGKEHNYCSSCNHYYSAEKWNCPNDH